ncbi:MAG: HAMP domain-containing sensor histidine kinase [Thermomicrobiales bacterium]
MRTLPVRFWLWLLLLVVVAVPAVTTLVFVVSGPPPEAVGRRFDRAVTPDLRQTLRDGVYTWDDPEWQRMLAAQLEPRGLAAMLIDAGGGTVYRSPGWPPLSADEGANPGRDLTHAAATLMVSTDAGTAIAVLVPTPLAAGTSSPWFDTEFWRIPFAQMAALILIVAAIALFVQQAFLNPLTRMVAAMRLVGAGDLAVRLPRSRVTEVDDVATAFGAMAEAMRHSLEREEALEQERRLTIGALVHDLRTPLFSLRGYLEGLATGLADTPEKTARYLRVCRERADALERLVSDLFEYTRTEYLEEAPRPAPLDLGEILRRVAEGLLPQAEAKSVHLVLAGVEEPVLVSGDAMLLMRAAENVLDNAVRHTPGGGKITIMWRQDANVVTFSVADTGPGIPADDLPHLFTPFYRGEASRNRRTGGAGLGLAIARRLLRAHGGDLTAGQASSGGALFTGSLPVLSPAAALASGDARGVTGMGERQRRSVPDRLGPDRMTAPNAGPGSSSGPRPRP